MGSVSRRFPDASDRLSVSLPGFFRTVYLTPRMRLTDFSSPSRRCASTATRTGRTCGSTSSRTSAPSAGCHHARLSRHGVLGHREGGVRGGGGLRSGAFAGRPASHRQAVRVEEEIVDAHREDAVFVADGFDHVAYEDDLLEAVVDLEQRGLLLRDLLRCGQLVCGLNVAAPVADS